MAECTSFFPFSLSLPFLIFFISFSFTEEMGKSKKENGQKYVSGRTAESESHSYNYFTEYLMAECNSFFPISFFKFIYI